MMSLLVRTLSYAGKPIMGFMVTVVILLVGSGQGFYMAFGRDLVDYRSFQHSILSLLRMAVGDFDYNELVYSQSFLGPVLFWIYIFLMFFVVMSMFVALISEAYESA